MARGASTKEPVPSPNRGNEVVDPNPRTSDPMHLHQAMLEVHKELTANTAVLTRAVADLDKQGDKIHDLLISFSWFKGVFAASAFLMFVFAGLVWWLVGTQISDLKNELLHRPPPQITGNDLKK
jgi:hypothetical protein